MLTHTCNGSWSVRPESDRSRSPVFIWRNLNRQLCVMRQGMALEHGIQEVGGSIPFGSRGYPA